MLIPLPLLVWFATITNQPIVVYIAPGESPVYIQPAQEVKPPQTAEYVGNCYQLVCNT
jgi:hypothetical protein